MKILYSLWQKVPACRSRFVIEEAHKGGEVVYLHHSHIVGSHGNKTYARLSDGEVEAYACDAMMVYLTAGRKLASCMVAEIDGGGWGCVFQSGIPGNMQVVRKFAPTRLDAMALCCAEVSGVTL